MVSPPKPWERGYVKNANTTAPSAPAETAVVTTDSAVKDTASDATAVATSSNAPALPPRPTTSSLTRTGKIHINKYIYIIII